MAAAAAPKALSIVSVMSNKLLAAAPTESSHWKQQYVVVCATSTALSLSMSRRGLSATSRSRGSFRRVLKDDNADSRINARGRRAMAN